MQFKDSNEYEEVSKWIKEQQFCSKCEPTNNNEVTK